MIIRSSRASEEKKSYQTEQKGRNLSKDHLVGSFVECKKKRSALSAFTAPQLRLNRLFQNKK
jgi:hypothetical protein